MQTSKANEYTTTQYIREIISKKGITGMYRGLVPTIMKDTLFGASFLGHYFTLRDYFSANPVAGVPEWGTTFVSGATAQCASWLLLIPIDTIKTRAQRAGETRNIGQIISSTVRNEGILSLWRGVIPACVRTIPVSGVAMVGYEYIRNTLGSLIK